ncbi:MAG: methylenetetrahydrofolate reductase [Rhodoluna sp.]|nr:methylenetetrahydrofolate reductase [Rhodoluna sp.]
MTEGFSIAKALTAAAPTLSFEFFPPKDEAGANSLRNSIEELMTLSPDFVSVTYGAMGSNQDSSVAIVEQLSKIVATVAHLTCIGASTSGIQNLLMRYQSAGVAAILALRGDKPKGYDEQPAGDFTYASDLVRQVKQFTSFEVGVAAFPEKHPESHSLADDIRILKMKQDTGASFAMTQLFFDVEAYSLLVRSARAEGVTIPIIPGVMPFENARQVLRMAQMSGATVPPELDLMLSQASNEEAARKIGMDFSVHLVQDLLAAGAPGIHIFTLNQHRATLELANSANLA